MTTESFEIEQIDPSEIAVTERLVSLREEHVLDLAEHMERSRYVQPILVVRLTEPENGARFRLIAGRHRTEACRLLGWPVPAMVYPEAQLAEGEELLLEALENSGRLVLTHAQRVRHEQIVIAYYEERLGRPLSKEERAERVADAARRNGVAKRTAQSLIQRAEELSPEVLEAAKGTPLDNNRGLALLVGMKDDEARLRRIEHELRRQADQADRRQNQHDTARQSALWILEILEKGLARQEIDQIAKMLPLTSMKFLREVLAGKAETGTEPEDLAA